MNVANRLQRDWVKQWVTYPGAVLPYTTMLRAFEDKNLTDENKAKFGHASGEHIDLVLDYVYEAGRRRHTFGEEILSDPKFKERDIKSFNEQTKPTLNKPKFATVKIVESQFVPVIKKKVKKAVVVKSKPAPKVSSIVLHEGESEYTGAKVQGNTSRVIGVVKFEGTNAPKRKKIGMRKDPKCINNGKNSGPEDVFIMNKKTKTLQNVYITVTEGLPRTKWKVSKSPVVIDQIGCRYTPAVAGIMVKQQLLVLNSDGTSHNVKCIHFNKSTPPGAQMKHKFKKAESLALGCDIHAWMSGTIHVSKHPFFAVSDVEGRFEIVGLPDGTYTLEASHGYKGMKVASFEVTIKKGQSVRVNDVQMSR